MLEFGHFLAVLWTDGRGASPDNSGPRLVKGLFELDLSQFGENRRDTAP